MTSSREVISTENRGGYDLQTVKFTGPEYGVPEGESFTTQLAVTAAGDYIGDEQTAEALVTQRGIKPELADPSHGTCSIGFREADRKWYGWSHRAICGFGIGDKLFDARYELATEATPFVEHGTVTIKTLDQARQAAINFAESVS